MATDQAKVEETVAKAIYDTAVQAAREAIDKLKFDHADIVDFVRRIASESETAQILIF